MIRRPPRSTRTDTLFPYTTLVRSWAITHDQQRDSRFACEMIDRASQYKPAQCLITRHTSNDEIAFRTGGRPEYDFDRVACLDMDVDFQPMRSEERRVGKECVSTCRSRWSPSH